MAIKSNIVIDQGTDFEFTVNVADANSEIVTLSGYNGYAQLRKHYTSSRKYDFNVAVTANTGEITLTMSANTSANITAGRYVYDCIVVSNANTVSRIIEGIVTINPRVTR